MADASDLFEKAKSQWHNRSGLVYAIFCVNAILALTPVAWTIWHLISSTVASTSVFVWWLLHQQPPKAKRGKIGFAITIYCSDEAVDLRVKEDFIVQLKKLVKSGSVGEVFDFIEIPKQFAIKDLDHEQALHLAKKSRSHFLIFGRVRIRDIAGQPHHIFDLSGLVRHAPLPSEMGQQFANEFTELLPQRINIPKENDLLAFEFASEIAGTVAQYIIGIALAVSGDIHHAERMYSEVAQRITHTSGYFPAYEKIKSRIATRFFEIFEAKAKAAYMQWNATREPAFIDEMSRALSGIPETESYSSRISILRSICTFLSTRDTKKSLAYLDQYPQKKNAIWHFNVAFVCGYEGDLAKSIQHYRLGVKSPMHDLDAPALSEIEDFISWVLQTEESKHQLHYCLGFFNWKVRGDLVLAKQNFDNFLRLVPTQEFKNARALATKWIEEISSESAGR